jgi:LAS superfamily LD-carboxypeptidase LdcB
MADNETTNQIPTSSEASATSLTTDTLKKYIVDLGRKAFESSNAVPAPAAKGTLALPQLAESFHTGYTNGDPKDITCCVVNGFLLEKNTAYDYILMSNAAAKDGIGLPIRSGFRTMDEQTRLYNERKNPAVAKEKGVAARPGYSNHQSGIAIDIHVKMKKADYIAGIRTAEYLWLEKFGPSFGFDHAEGHKVNEPWHWTHLPTTIVGTAAYQSATGMAVLTSATAVNASASNQLGTLRILNQEGHDSTVGLSRSSTFPDQSRQGALAENAVFKANSSNYVSHTVSQLQAGTQTLSEVPAGFIQDSLKPLVYNFATGLWGDNKPV